MVAIVRGESWVRERVPTKWGATDTDVVDAARAGCAESVARLYVTIGERVRRTAWSILEDEHAAEDAVQDTFVAVLERVGRLRDSVAFETWVLRIARNIAINARRRRGRCRPSAHVHDDAGAAEDAVVTRWGSREPGPVHVASVRTSIQEMSTAVRETMELRYGAGLSCEAIARRQGISLASVKTRLHRGRRAMREALRGGG